MIWECIKEEMTDGKLMWSGEEWDHTQSVVKAAEGIR